MVLSFHLAWYRELTFLSLDAIPFCSLIVCSVLEGVRVWRYHHLVGTTMHRVLPFSLTMPSKLWG